MAISPPKYRNTPVMVGDIRFASKREAKRFGELKLLERGKEISGLTLQPRYPLIVNGHKVCTYIADFCYFDVKLRKIIVEDSKGMRTKDYIIKRKLFMALQPDLEHREV